MLETWAREGRDKSLKDGEKHAREMHSGRFGEGIDDIEIYVAILHRWKTLEESKKVWDQEQMGKGREETGRDTEGCEKGKLLKINREERWRGRQAAEYWLVL